MIKKFSNFRKNLAVSLFVCLCIIAEGIFIAVSASQKPEISQESKYFQNKNDYVASSKIKTNATDKSSSKGFTLTNHLGTKASLSDYKGKVVILLFGYTNCPDVCPMELAEIDRVIGKLGNKADQVQVLFITVDPERDTPEVLKEYLAFYNPSFVGLSGTVEEIYEVARRYKAHFVKREVGSEAGYLMGHTSSIYLIDKEGELFNTYPLNPDSFFWDLMKTDIENLI